MGVVYSARDEKLERVVALKTMSSMATDETARRRFWREARAAATVNHPNVCQIYDIGEDDGTLFIAMELLEGESLAERLHRGALNASDAVPVALGILAALTALHSRGIVHRDLKPSNVFLTPFGVKLLDFGLARPELDRSLDVTGPLTQTGIVVGTPRYMSPEQAAGGPADARSDLFAAGAILFEMLAGRPAFSGRTVVDILHATLHEHPPALAGSPAVTAIDRVIRRALAKRPDDRPPSAEMFADELRAVHGLEEAGSPALALPLTRIVVLPFRILRPDPESDFRVQPSGCHRDVAGGHRLADCALQRHRCARRQRSRGSQGARSAGRCRSRGHGHAAAERRSVTSGGTARRDPERHAADVAHRAVVDGRPLSPAGRHRAPRRRGACPPVGRPDAVAAP
jgi:serine/threonine protein kinase